MASYPFDYASTFEGQSFCTCEDCRSIFSPAAYLVELLTLLGDNRGLLFFGDDKSLRRADIGNVELSCQNTNTALPYIDLVNEVLEIAVAGTPTTTTWPQTTRGADEIAANPENVTAAAYSVLAAERYAWSLPFSLGSATARTFLDHLGVHRQDLMSALGSDAASVAIESLSITPAERACMLPLAGGASPATLAPFWWPKTYTPSPDDWNSIEQKLTSPAALPDKPLALGLLDRSGLSFDDLVALLGTQFVNSGQAFKIVFGSVKAGVYQGAPGDGDVTEQTCDILTAGFVPPLDAPALDRLHRFERLRRKLGWTALSLDKALTALGATEIDGTLLIKLSYVKGLQDALAPPLLPVLAFFSAIDTQPGEGGGPSLYDQLFQNPALPLDPGLDHTALSGTLDAHASGILAGLGIDAPTLALLVARIPGAALSLGNLSALYRQVILAHALGLSMPDFLTLRDLSGVDPFSATDLSQALRFVQTARNVMASGFSMADIDYLLLDDYTEGDGIGPTSASIGVLLQEVSAGLAKIASDTATVIDPNGDLLRADLALVLATQTDIAAAMTLIGAPPATTTKTQLGQYFGTFVDLDAALDKLVTNPLPLDQRYAFLLAAYLQSSLGQTFVKQKVGAWLGLDISVTTPLLGQPMTRLAGAKAMDKLLALTTAAPTGEDPLVTAQGHPDQTTASSMLWKTAVLLKRLRLTAERQGIPDGPVSLIQRGEALGYPVFNKLPSRGAAADPTLFSGWSRLVDLVGLIRRFPRGSTSFFDIFSATALPAWSQGVLERTGWSETDLAYLATAPQPSSSASGPFGSLGFHWPADYQDERVLVRLSTCFQFVGRLGVSAQQADGWRDPGKDDPPAASPVARAIRQAAKAKYDNATWLTIARPLQDRLRVAQRDALVAWLTSQRQAAFPDTNSLFDHYLLDSQVTPAVITSRLKQAIGSTQLFVQRAFMGLERGATLGGDLTVDHWTKWMYGYGLWEANRQVFAYPESFIHPDLRPDPTPFFGDMQSALLQRDPTSDVVEDCFRSYLEKLDQVARLEVVALVHDPAQDLGNGATNKDTVHVFARTFGDPHVYFYRRLAVDDERWTPWEKVDVDIQSEQLLPVIWNGRLFLFWPIFTEKPTDPSVQSSPIYLEVQIAWSEYKPPKWLAKKISSNAVDNLVTIRGTTAVPIPPPPYSPLSLRAETDGSGDLTILISADPPAGARVTAIHAGSNVSLAGTFDFSSCGSAPIGSGKVSLGVSTGRSVRPTNTDVDAQAFAGSSSLSLPAQGRGSVLTLAKIDQKTYKVIVQHDQNGYPVGEPFFYQDRLRAFYATPLETVDVSHPDTIDPWRFFVAKPPPIGSTLPDPAIDELALAKVVSLDLGGVQ